MAPGVEGHLGEYSFLTYDGKICQKKMNLIMFGSID